MKLYVRLLSIVLLLFVVLASPSLSAPASMTAASQGWPGALSESLPPQQATNLTDVNGGDHLSIGTDGNPFDWAVYDVTSLQKGPRVPIKAIADGLSGNYAVIHYFRADGDYGDHTTGDFNDYWGLHLWGDITETIEWTAPKPFLGEDEYGRFAWVSLAPNPGNVGFIVHRGDTKDGTDADRFFNPGATPEIWLKQNDANTYTSQAEAQGYVTIHYHRDDGDYGDPTSPDFNDLWGLHLWGDAIDPSEGTEWTNPKKPTGFDEYGAFWDIIIQNAGQPVNFIIHRGDTKDPGPDESFIPEEMATVWKQSGDKTVYPQRGAAENFATIHYHRDDGDYGDPTSPNFNDFWGLHVWADAATPNPSWVDPIRPAGFDIFGPFFEIDLTDSATVLAYIIHRGDTKDPGPDQFLFFDLWGYEVWQLEGANPESPYILPISIAPPPYPPTAAFTWAPEPQDEGSEVQFTDSSTDDGAIVAWAWDFGGQGTSNAQSPTFTFDDNGDYNVCLTVTDDGGSEATACEDVTINNVAPTAIFRVADSYLRLSNTICSGESAIFEFAEPYDPSTTDTDFGFTYLVDCTNDGEFDYQGSVVTYSLCPPSEESFTAKGRIEDKDYGSTDYFIDITVLAPAAATDELITAVQDLNLAQGIDNSLGAKLESVKKVLDDLNTNNDIAALDLLQAFINAVEAQRGKGIPDEEANFLISSAQRVINSLMGG